MKRNMCSRAMAKNLACQSSGWYIYLFGKHKALKPLIHWWRHFPNCDFEHIYTLHRKKWHFWNPVIKLDQKQILVFENFNSKILPYMWPEVDPTPLFRWLAWSQIAKWFRFLNSTCTSDYKSSVACPRKIFFILVTSHDHSLPAIEPDPYLVPMPLMLTGYLQ